MDKITKAQWEAFRIVRDMGDYNMLDPRARAETGLDKPTYLSIIHHYEELEQKYENK